MRQNSFLYQVAEKIKTKDPRDMRKLVIVFPNRRSGRVFQRHLAKQANSPLWSPLITTIDDFFKSQSDLTVADPLTQLNSLHRIWNRISDKGESFEQFYFFGKILIKDFDLLDKYLVNADKLYSHIKDLKEVEAAFQMTAEDSEGLRRIMEYFSGELKEGSAGDKFMKVWRQLAEIYHRFNRDMREQQLAYSGMIYRDLAENLSQIRTESDTRFVFAGFNRINRCEERLFAFLQKNQLAQFYWNQDPYLTGTLAGEAGKFLVSNLKKFPATSYTGTDLRADQKEFRIIPSSFQSLQAQMVVRLMEERNAANMGTEQKAGVVLNDENLLLPLLWALPKDRIEINVSAGLNLIKTPAYDLMRDIILLREEALRTNGEFHYRNVEKIFLNPYLPGGYKKWMEAVQYLKDGKILDHRDQVYFSAKELLEMMDEPIMEEIFKSDCGAVQLVQSILKVLEYAYELQQSEDEQGDLITVQQEVMRSGHQVLVKLRDLLTDWPGEVKPALLRNMLRDIAQNRRIPFKGEPLSGIQLMGALESRNVSYDHLILPSLNEGVQPSAPGQTLIPFSLKKYFGMPVVEDEMADQSYYFWTLIAGAKSVDILYDNSSSGMKKSEKSRFVQQIQFGDFDNWGSMQESKLKMPLENNKPEEIVIERTAQIQQQLLEQLVDRGLSPSSLIKFLQCELRFYFQFVLGADEYQDIPEEVDARLSGSILHKTMENLYKPYCDRELQKGDFKDLKLRLPKVLRETLKEERRLKGKEIAGHDYVAERYLSKIIKRVLEYDCSRSPFTMVEHERKIDLKVVYKGHEIKFGGFVDRIHRDESGYRIVDYKTGGDKLDFKKEQVMPLPGNDVEKASSLNTAAIQLLIYCWLLEKEEERFEKAALYPELYLTRKITEGFTPGLLLKVDKYQEMVNTESEFYRDFTLHLESTLGQLLNPNRPFRQAADQAVCEYCPFNNICMR